MQILSGLQNDHCHQLDSAGAYEWWYADALDATGEWGVVMILFRGMPMSPDYLANPSLLHGGYALSIYHRGVRIAFAFGGHNLEACLFAQDSPQVRMPGAELTVDDASITMSIDAPCGGDGRRARVMMTMSAATKHPPPRTHINDAHAWVLAAPRSPASVQICIHESHGKVVDHSFSTMAYHDHNLGSRAMSVDYRDWYWGRFHDERCTYVYLATRRSVDPVLWFGRIHEDGRTEPFSNVQLELRQPRVSMMGLGLHKIIDLSGMDADGRLVTARCTNSKVCEDGPFYQRYVSRWDIDGDAKGLGMSEYMDVGRLKQAWIRPFLRLPWMVSS